MHLETDREKGAHLLRRFGLGASEAELDFYLQDGLRGAVDRLVDFDSIDEGFHLDIESMGTNAKGQIPMPAVVAWWILRMLQTRHPLQEKMTLFWHNHFATGADKVKVPMNMFQQNEILRRNCVGNFSTLLSEVSKDPAMLIWLDNVYNVRGRANENFAREVMELFTLGIGNYTEKDIQESARAYTGWSLQRKKNGPDAGPKNRGGEFVFRPRLHDDGEKTFFGQTGNYTGDDILAMLCKMPRTAEFITHKIWTFFAYPNPEPELISSLAREFHQSSLDIKTLLRAIMNSSEFYSDKAYRAVYKNPADVVVTTARQLGLGEKLAELAQPAGGRGNLGPIRLMNTAMKGMGMQLLYPPDVSGWAQGAAWITTATMVERIGWADKLFGGPGEQSLMRFQSYGLFQKDPSPMGVASKLTSIFDAPLGQAKMAKLAEAARKIGGDRVAPETANATAKEVARLIFATPEFQFC